MGSPKIEHNPAVVARLLNGLESASNGLEIKTLSASSELPGNFVKAVTKAETEFEEIITCLKEYKVLFKDDITRIRRASEEIVSHEKQVASKLSAALEPTVKTGIKAGSKKVQ
ncbi:TPA_asm: hypothetical protein GIN74_12940 [Listeria monocytogenes]|uniref:hypothetical protein n=1 Tax=Listeria monocytogenes TaxID=1639 RepID=UPI000A1D519F|nr:hypothetical protein [Listeria monocytogenes]ARM71710.1 hypothetical protein LMxysn_0075 [Listeria monocytogenes]HAB0010295.1 hypothetical protein [Listeria monocytogenes]